MNAVWQLEFVIKGKYIHSCSTHAPRKSGIPPLTQLCLAQNCRDSQGPNLTVLNYWDFCFNTSMIFSIIISFLGRCFLQQSEYRMQEIAARWTRLSVEMSFASRAGPLRKRCDLDHHSLPPPPWTSVPGLPFHGETEQRMIIAVPT